jgi:hypothetical protein
LSSWQRGRCELDKQVEKSGESITAEMTERLLRGFGYVAIEATQ